MRRGDRRVIKVDGQEIDAEYLGAGHYCRAFRAKDLVYCFVDEEDMSKEILAVGAMCSVPEGTLHLPRVVKHEQEIGRGGVYRNVYSMPFYPGLKARHAEAWSVYTRIRAAVEKVRPKYVPWEKPLSVYGAYFNNDVIEEVEGEVPATVTNALTELNNAACNYGSGMTFEFAVRNIGVDEDDERGRIVFRDCVFDAAKIAAEMEQRRRMGGWR